MKLSAFIQHLNSLQTIAFQLPNGTLVPPHFHVTEVGKITKNFIDCGGTKRNETVINFQLWSADDYNHRLHPQKLSHIINLSIAELDLPDAEIEVEYQADTIGKYGLSFDGVHFNLTSKATDCLAKDNCGIPAPKKKVALSSLGSNSCCEGQC